MSCPFVLIKNSGLKLFEPARMRCRGLIGLVLYTVLYVIFELPGDRQLPACYREGMVLCELIRQKIGGVVR